MIRPLYSRFDNETGQWIFGLSEDDFHRVQQGYGCGNCLEDYGGKWLPKCPVCGNETEVVVGVKELMG